MSYNVPICRADIEANAVLHALPESVEQAEQHQLMRKAFHYVTWRIWQGCWYGMAVNAMELLSLHKAQVTASLHQPAPVSSSRPTREPLPGLSLFDCDTLCGLQCFWWVTEEGFGSCYAGAGANQTRKLSEADAEWCLEPISTKPYEAMCLLGEVTHRVLQELFALLVGRALIEDCFDNFGICPNHLPCHRW